MKGLWHCDTAYKMALNKLYVLWKVILGCENVGSQCTNIRKRNCDFSVNYQLCLNGLCATARSPLLLFAPFSTVISAHTFLSHISISCFSLTSVSYHSQVLVSYQSHISALHLGLLSISHLSLILVSFPSLILVSYFSFLCLISHSHIGLIYLVSY